MAEIDTVKNKAQKSETKLITSPTPNNSTAAALTLGALTLAGAATLKVVKPKTTFSIEGKSKTTAEVYRDWKRFTEEHKITPESKSFYETWSSIPKEHSLDFGVELLKDRQITKQIFDSMSRIVVTSESEFVTRSDLLKKAGISIWDIAYLHSNETNNHSNANAFSLFGSQPKVPNVIERRRNSVVSKFRLKIRQLTGNEDGFALMDLLTPSLLNNQAIQRPGIESPFGGKNGANSQAGVTLRVDTRGVPEGITSEFNRLGKTLDNKLNLILDRASEMTITEADFQSYNSLLSQYKKYAKAIYRNINKTEAKKIEVAIDSYEAKGKIVSYFHSMNDRFALPDPPTMNTPVSAIRDAIVTVDNWANKKGYSQTLAWALRTEDLTNQKNDVRVEIMLSEETFPKSKSMQERQQEAAILREEIQAAFMRSNKLRADVLNPKKVSAKVTILPVPKPTIEFAENPFLPSGEKRQAETFEGEREANEKLRQLSKSDSSKIDFYMKLHPTTIVVGDYFQTKQVDNAVANLKEQGSLAAFLLTRSNGETFAFIASDKPNTADYIFKVDPNNPTAWQQDAFRTKTEIIDSLNGETSFVRRIIHTNNGGWQKTVRDFLSGKIEFDF